VDRPPAWEPKPAPPAAEPTRPAPSEETAERPDPGPGPKPPADTPRAEPKRIAFVLAQKAGTLWLTREGAEEVETLQGDRFDGKGTVSFRTGPEPARAEFGGHVVSFHANSRGALSHLEAAWALTLEEGEVFCVVDPQRKTAFSVETGFGTATALGTAFGVRTGKGETEVYVTEGRVKASSPRGSVRIDPERSTRLRPEAAPECAPREEGGSPRWLERLRPSARIALHRTRGARAARRLGPRHLRDRRLARQQRMTHRWLSEKHRRGMAAKPPRGPRRGAGNGGRRGGRNGSGAGGRNGGGRGR
jgi:hypothetical protein